MAAKKKPVAAPGPVLDLFAPTPPPVIVPVTRPALLAGTTAPLPPLPRPAAPVATRQEAPPVATLPEPPAPVITGNVHCACRGTQVVQALPEEVADRWSRRAIVMFSSWRIARTGIEGVLVPWPPGGCYVDILITDARLLPDSVEREPLPCPSCCDPAPAIGRTIILSLHGRLVHGPVGVAPDETGSRGT